MSELNSRSGSISEDRFHDTKKLLNQYRRIQYAVETSVEEINARMEIDHGTQIFVDQINAELAGIDLTGTKLEKYAQCVIRSKNMLCVLNSAMERLKRYPNRGELYYHVLYQTYFTKVKPRNRDCVILELEKLGYPMSASSYYNYLSAAIRSLDSILWGYTARESMDIIDQLIPDEIGL